MKHKVPERFLVIRFRQMGDAVLATSLLNSIKRSFPGSTTDFVLNERIAPLFRGHPAVDRIITFSDRERHSPLIYIRKIWKIMRRGRYDVIIDMRSTVNTLPFSLLSPFSRFRIGIRKPYTWFVFNRRLPECSPSTDMVSHNLSLLSPLEKCKELSLNRGISLSITPPELENYKRYLIDSGVDTDSPVLLCGVAAKLAYKSWPRKFMVDVLRRVMADFPGLQMVFNYAPGQEAEVARGIFEELGCPPRVFINVQAASMRELVALSSLCSGFFGNEGGARHVVHAAGRPSLVVVSPGIDKTIWIPDTGVFAEGISCEDIMAHENLAAMGHFEKYSAITPDYVYPRLRKFIEEHIL